MFQIDWFITIPLAIFIIFGLGYIIADKKHTGESWSDIFFN